jgi:ActR/RegA family two-component response regulator
VDSAKAASELIYSGEQITMAVIDLMLIPDQETIRPALELIATLRKRLPDCAIIALTRNYSVSFGREAIRYGANDFVCTKWYDRDSWEDHLQKRIELWLPGAIPTISATA